MKQTVVEWLITQLQAPCRGIPSHIIEQANKMFEDQIIEAFKHGELPPLFVNFNAKEYYKETYGSESKSPKETTSDLPNINPDDVIPSSPQFVRQTLI